MTTCLECGRPIPADKTTCPTCGADAILETSETGFRVYDGQPLCNCDICAKTRAVHAAQGVEE